ncbi:dynein regulatory complex subunit 3 [Anastrepha obliqua]|uniref:dynein regulatory complex subunit 3 n=1 Tax=Anastrepha obliqua TaxID=95512 RepID=UPI002409D26F|nr:dynein regulatory complex subunit 3 [Anastrepha obliqua]
MTESKKTENVKPLDEIIYPEIEPGIISKQMIDKAYLEDGKQGEEARLHQMEPVVYERISVLRLEFKNILRIDHLWIMPNLTKLSLNSNKIEVIEHIDMLTSLKELDLSFNYIERIENIKKLVNLEVLTLFRNMITKIENLDTLEKLVILSLGDNKIHSTEGIERFRFLKDLRVLNLEGNPVGKKPDFQMNLYVAAVLPSVKFYEYKTITEELRQKGKEKYYRELREIEANEEKEILARAAKAKEEYDEQRLASSFVEYLNEHQLYESLWKGDEDGHALLQIGQAATDLADEYDNDIYDVTQEIYKYGLERYEERELEINEFKENLEEGQKLIQQMGQDVIEGFLHHKDRVFDRASAILKALELRTVRGEDEESPESLELLEQFDKITMQFDDTINEIWQQLMSQELHLHESIEESTVNFQRRIQEMMAKFVEQVQTYFGQLRDIAIHFSENMAEVATHYVNTKLALQDFDDVPPELLHCMEDREAVLNLIAGMKDSHIQRIDEREDRLMVRSRDFIENMIDELNNDELERNRAKILEINSFLELMAESLASLQSEIRDEVMNEEA